MYECLKASIWSKYQQLGCEKTINYLKYYIILFITSTHLLEAASSIQFGGISINCIKLDVAQVLLQCSETELTVLLRSRLFLQSCH